MKSWLSILIGCSLAQPVLAQTYPSKPVRLIVTQAPGSGTDIFARYLSDRVSRYLGQTVVVDNRVGASNIIGAQAAARSAPDGYTLLYATSASLVLNPFTFKSLPYDPLKDFAPISRVASSAFVIGVHPSVPANSLAELIAWEKARSGTVSLATDGPRFVTGILSQYINKVAGTRFVIIPYANIMQGLQDTVAGRAEVMVQSMSIMAPFAKEGKLRILAYSGPGRNPSYPDVPAMSETLSNVKIYGWFMVLAPSGTPVPILQRINQEADRALNEPDTERKMRELGFTPDGGGSLEAARQFVASEYEYWGRVIRDIGIEPE